MRTNPPKPQGRRPDYRPTPGATRKQFTRWVTTIGGSRAAAATLGVSRSYVDMIKSGDRSPGLVTAHRIARQTKGAIPMEAWIDEAGNA